MTKILSKKSSQLVQKFKSKNCVEIGCGHGILSGPLSEQFENLNIIEIDSHFLEYTQNLLKDKKNIHYHLSDALKFNFNQLKDPFVIIANIPYQISAPLLKKCLEYHSKIEALALMVQKRSLH